MFVASKLRELNLEVDIPRSVFELKDHTAFCDRSASALLAAASGIHCLINVRLKPQIQIAYASVSLILANHRVWKGVSRSLLIGLTLSAVHIHESKR